MLRRGDFGGETLRGFFRRIAWLRVTERNGEALNARDGGTTGERREHVLDRPRRNENMVCRELEPGCETAA